MGAGLSVPAAIFWIYFYLNFLKLSGKASYFSSLNSNFWTEDVSSRPSNRFNFSFFLYLSEHYLDHCRLHVCSNHPEGCTLKVGGDHYLGDAQCCQTYPRGEVILRVGLTHTAFVLAILRTRLFGINRIVFHSWQQRRCCESYSFWPWYRKVLRAFFFLFVII